MYMIESAPALVQNGFAQLESIEDPTQNEEIGIRVKMTEPLAVEAFRRMYLKDNGDLLLDMANAAWDPLHCGRLFEPFLTDPLRRLFWNQGQPFNHHPLISHIDNINKIALLGQQGHVIPHTLDLAVRCNRASATVTRCRVENGTPINSPITDLT
jgi:hypothetical protein